METRVAPGSVLSRLPGRRLFGAGLVALALSAAVVTGVSANGGPGGRFGGDGITVTAINGNQLTLATADGWSRTVDATGVTVMNGTATATLADLTVGDEIGISQSRNFDGSVAVTQISIVAPHVEGGVTAVDASSITVKQADGTSRTVTLTATTTYSNCRDGATVADVTVGSRVNVLGTANADGSFTATSVSTHAASLGGMVTATTATSITVKDASGATATITVSGTTTYRAASGTGTIADVTVGSVVRAEGALNADGSLTATSVQIGTAGDGFGRGFGGGRHGGHGPGGPGGPGGRGGQNGQPAAPGAPAAPSAAPSA